MKRIFRDPPAAELVPELKQVGLPEGLEVGEARNIGNPVDALDFHPRAALDADVHVLAGAADPGPHLSRSPGQLPQDLGHLGDLPGGAHVGVGDGFN